MSDSAVQAQWDLTGTSGTAWETVRGFMVASTSDNVQPLALMVCERFGGTLAMSSDTTNKVHHVLLPSEPAPISFIKETVGFFRNDCASQLGKSEAGLRFLGLAAALVSSLSAFEGAKALELMLKRTTIDATFLPTVRHLKEVLCSLGARSLRCGFTELSVTWQMLLRNEASSHVPQGPSPHVPQNPPPHRHSRLLEMTPSPEMIAGLVDVFRQVARMGPATVIGATIKTGYAAPWVVAFAQWCVEAPSVFLADRPVVERPGSRIRVVLSNNPNQPLEAIVHHQVKELTPLLLGPPPPHNPAYHSSSAGMVTVEAYGAWLLLELGFGGGAIRVLRETLQYAIPQVLRKMKCGRFARLGQDSSSSQWRRRPNDMRTADAHCLSPLPNIRTIAATCITLLGLEDPIKFTALDDSTLVADLPQVARYLLPLEQNYRCKDCLGRGSIEWCEKDGFFRSLSFLIMDIFALSLFESTSTLLLRLSVNRESRVYHTGMQTRLSDVIKTGDSRDFNDLELIAWAKNMVGHAIQGEDSVIISSSKGQVVYPRVFDTRHFEEEGYLKLCCLPGVLRYQGETYDVVSYPLRGISRRKCPNTPTFRPSVLGPLNLCKEFGSSWSISVRDSRELWAAVQLHSKANGSLWIEQDPLSSLQNIKNTLVVDGCPHDPRAELERADQSASYNYPWDWYGERPPGTSFHVDVVAVDGSDDLRYFALAYVRPGSTTALRRNSCLSCCLNVCRDNNIHVLIL